MHMGHLYHQECVSVGSNINRHIKVWKPICLSHLRTKIKMGEEKGEGTIIQHRTCLKTPDTFRIEVYTRTHASSFSCFRLNISSHHIRASTLRALASSMTFLWSSWALLSRWSVPRLSHVLPNAQLFLAPLVVCAFLHASVSSRFCSWSVFKRVITSSPRSRYL